MTDATEGRLRFDRSDTHVVDELRAAEASLRDERSRAVPDMMAAELLADVMAQWAFLGQVDPDMLNRIGGPETVRLARYINERHRTDQD